MSYTLSNSKPYLHPPSWSNDKKEYLMQRQYNKQLVLRYKLLSCSTMCAHSLWITWFNDNSLFARWNFTGFELIQSNKHQYCTHREPQHNKLYVLRHKVAREKMIYYYKDWTTQPQEKCYFSQHKSSSKSSHRKAFWNAFLVRALNNKLSLVIESKV